MPPKRLHRRSAPLVIALAFAVFVVGPSSVPADRLTLKSGIVLEGTSLGVDRVEGRVSVSDRPDKKYPLQMVETGMRRVFVPTGQLASPIERESIIGQYETFPLKQRRTNRQVMLSTVGLPSKVTRFDQHGRRRVTFNTARGPLDVVQGITEIGPKYCRVEGLSHVWEFGVATTSIEPEMLDAMIHSATDQQNPDHRRAIILFYIQAELYPQAEREMAQFLTEFPDFEAKIENIRETLREHQARRVLYELQQRQSAGQYRLAYLAAKQFPEAGLGAEVQRQVTDLVRAYESDRNNAEFLLARLGDLEAGLEDAELRGELASWRAVIRNEIDMDSLQRLTAFRNLHDDDTLTARERIALAYSGWLLGNADALTDLDAARRLWTARYLVEDYLRAGGEDERRRIALDLKNLESVTVERVLAMLPMLDLPIETPHLVPGDHLHIEADSAIGKVNYSVLLPLEYNPRRKYPAVVSLRPAERSTDDMLTWWGGSREKPLQSQRRGYIVIAPEYADEDQKHHDYSARTREYVEAALFDARKRFRIDSDRVFLSGHGMGADAAFDIGMSRPHLFAGVIPIAGAIDGHCINYWKNAEHLAWYVVSGELDQNRLERNPLVLNNMLRNSFDMQYVEYVGRGYESFYAEIHRIFDWMDAHQRVNAVKEFDGHVMRAADDQFYWIQADSYLPIVSNIVVPTRHAPAATGRGKRRPTFQFEVLDGLSATTVSVSIPARQFTLWFSPDIVDFQREMKIRVSGKIKFKGFPRPELATLLEDLRVRGDREKPFTMKKLIQ